MLVSVVIITYNSAKFILETLDSIYHQTHPEIELIITDDYSSDETIALAEDWLHKKGHRFVSAKLIKASKNQGIAPNCNQGAREAKGEWIKLLAGDDVLMPDCISVFHTFIQQNPQAHLVVGKMAIFTTSVSQPVSVWPKKTIPLDPAKQLRKQIKGGFIKAPAVFIRHQDLAAFGYFNERYLFLEDDPLWIKFLTHGHLFYPIDHLLVGYRIHEGSVSNGKVGRYTNDRFFYSLKRFKIEQVWPLMRKKHMYLHLLASKLEIGIITRIIEKKENDRSKVPLFWRMLLRITSYSRLLP